MVEIDGAAGEGGGQALRTSLSVACVLGKPVRVTKIRAGRSNPGLRAQHLSACMLLAEISGGKVKGADIGSQEIEFEPGMAIGGEYSFDIGTAGSCVLLLQSALPVLLHANKECALSVKGGTHVRGAPTYEYFSEVFLPAIRRFGAKCESSIRSFGFYPKGGGEIVVRTKPSVLSGCELLPEEAKGANYSIVSSSLPAHVAKREEDEIKGLVGNGMPLSGKCFAVHSPCAGNAISFWSGMRGGSAIGERGKPAGEVAREACRSAMDALAKKSAVDSHLADQLLLYAALAEGRTTFTAPKITSHLSTNAMVLRQMSGRNISLGSDGSVEVV